MDGVFAPQESSDASLAILDPALLNPSLDWSIHKAVPRLWPLCGGDLGLVELSQALQTLIVHPTAIGSSPLPSFRGL